MSYLAIAVLTVVYIGLVLLICAVLWPNGD